MERFLTEKQAADLLQISRATLAGWRREGVAPDHILLGSKSVRYSSQAIEKWVGEQRAERAQKQEVSHV